MSEREYEPYQLLANAIVVQAVRDYEKFYKAYMKNPCKDNLARLNHLRKFFLGEWFKALTKVNGEWLVSRIEADVKKGKKLCMLSRKDDNK